MKYFCPIHAILKDSSPRHTTIIFTTSCSQEITIAGFVHCWNSLIKKECRPWDLCLSIQQPPPNQLSLILPWLHLALWSRRRARNVWVRKDWGQGIPSPLWWSSSLLDADLPVWLFWSHICPHLQPLTPSPIILHSVSQANKLISSPEWALVKSYLSRKRG